MNNNEELNLKLVDSSSITIKEYTHAFLQQLNTILKAQVIMPLITKNWPCKVIPKSSGHMVVLKIYAYHADLDKNHKLQID